jgi:hypothetical protein
MYTRQMDRGNKRIRDEHGTKVCLKSMAWKERGYTETVGGNSERPRTAGKRTSVLRRR